MKAGMRALHRASGIAVGILLLAHLMRDQVRAAAKQHNQ